MPERASGITSHPGTIARDPSSKTTMMRYYLIMNAGGATYPRWLLSKGVTLGRHGGRRKVTTKADRVRSRSRAPLPPPVQSETDDVSIDVLVDVVPLAARGRLQGAPHLRLSIEPQAPSERPLSRSLTRMAGAVERGIIGGIELDRPELSGQSDASALASPEIPDRL